MHLRSVGVDELPTVVRVDPEQREGKHATRARAHARRRVGSDVAMADTPSTSWQRRSG
jgi:hypothetical protein